MGACEHFHQALDLPPLCKSATSDQKARAQRQKVTIFRLRPFRIAAYIIMGLSVAYGFAVLLESKYSIGACVVVTKQSSALLICKPIAYNWDTTIEGGSCANQTQAFEAVGILNLLTDIAIIILPMPWLWTLQLPISKKLGLTAIFGIGVV